MTILLERPTALAVPDIDADLTRRRMLQTTSILALFAAAGCADDSDDEPTAEPSEPTTKEIYHAFGSSQVPINISRLVVIDQAVTLEHVVALGVQPAGAPLSATPPPQVVELLADSVIDTGQSYPAEPERIAAVKPDLILGWSAFFEDGLEKRLAGIAPTVGTTRDGFGAWKDDLRFVGDVLNRRGRAEELIDSYEARVATLKEKFAPLADRNFAVISAADAGARIDGPDKSFPGPILTELGLRMGPRDFAGAEFNSVSGQLSFSLEYLPELNAVDGLLIWPRDEGDDRDTAIENNELWKGLDPVEEGRVAIVKGETWLQGSVISANLILDDLERLIATLLDTAGSASASPSPTSTQESS